MRLGVSAVYFAFRARPCGDSILIEGRPRTYPASCDVFAAFFSAIYRVLAKVFSNAAMLSFSAVAAGLTALIIPIYVDTSLIILGAVRNKLRETSTTTSPPDVRTEVRKNRRFVDSFCYLACAFYRRRGPDGMS